MNSGKGISSSGIAKVLVVGDVYVGKTSVINRYVRNRFNPDYQTTIGVDFSLKPVHTEDGEMKVQLWDIAGQERFAGLSRIFYTHAAAAIIVFDLTKRDSFENVVKWKKDIDAKVFLPSGAHIPVLLLANKVDVIKSQEEEVCCSDEDIQALVNEHSFFASFKVSAKSGENVKQACTHLVNKVAQNNKKEQEIKAKNPSMVEREDSKVVTLDDEDDSQMPPQQSGCC